MKQPFNSNRRWWLWWLLALGFVALDQILKQTTVATLPLHAGIGITPWFNWVHVLNPGAAFSFLADAGGWQRYVLGIIGLVVSATLLVALYRGLDSRSVTLSYVSIIGGAMGNVVDRVFRGAVGDYLDFYWKQWHWPAFNLADMLLVGGTMLLIYSTWSVSKTETERQNRTDG